MVAGEVITDAPATNVHLRYPIYLEGLNRQSFTVAIRDITAAVDGIGRHWQPRAYRVTRSDTEVDESKPVAPPSEPEPRAQTCGSRKPWAATHQVPATGMAAWTEPDPTHCPRHHPGRRGAVAGRTSSAAPGHAVTANNGWTGWVDARILQVSALAVPQPPRSPPRRFDHGRRPWPQPRRPHRILSGEHRCDRHHRRRGHGRRRLPQVGVSPTPSTGPCQYMAAV